MYLLTLTAAESAERPTLLATLRTAIQGMTMELDRYSKISTQGQRLTRPSLERVGRAVKLRRCGIIWQTLRDMQERPVTRDQSSQPIAGRADHSSLLLNLGGKTMAGRSNDY